MKLDPERMLRFRDSVLNSVAEEVSEENTNGLQSTIESKLLDKLALILIWMQAEKYTAEFEEWRSGLLVDLSNG